MRALPPEELSEAAALAGSWEPLRDARIFITGGTGFFGKWLLETLGEANRAHGIQAQAVVLSRDPGRFLAGMPHLAGAPWLSFHQGDVAASDFPSGGFTHLIHGAASSDARDYGRDPAAMRRVLAEGTARVMDFAGRLPGPVRALMISSGAVYGPQPPHISHMTEDHPLPPDTEDPGQSYAQGKREAERIAAASGLPCPIARCFAFAGPHLPLDQHFAFGNFIRDGLAGGPIRVGGDGAPLRSYLYASELAAWLWALLMRGRSMPYHVGSDQAVSIRELAQAVGAATGASVEIAREADPQAPPARYVPAVHRIREDLGLSPTVDLAASIARTLRWHRAS